jgi:hypothetical protein
MTSSATALVVTSINPPNAVMTALRDGARAADVRFIVIGDTKSPADFHLEDCAFFSVAQQQASGLSFATACPTRHYARKNIGYLLAIRDGARIIIETDDDNFPRPAFFGTRQRRQTVAASASAGWLNLYKYFTDALIWPRGLPLDEVNTPLVPFETLRSAALDCPIQQGLADANPDVDAIYRLLLPLPQDFRADRRVALAPGGWCPFNSQNTTWWADAFPLLYLPAYCSFRMTDIWRSFVAQRIAAANGWHILFHEATVWQERNAHNLMRDFADEMPGYLNNSRIRDALQALDLTPGREHLAENLRRCYGALVSLGVVGAEELPLLEAWLRDITVIWKPDF